MLATSQLIANELLSVSEYCKMRFKSVLPLHFLTVVQIYG
jgi:hypothetical protein